MVLLLLIGIGCVEAEQVVEHGGRSLPDTTSQPQPDPVDTDPVDAGDTGVLDTGDAGEDSAGPALNVDVLVLGAGAAGMAAALEAQELGASVLILEMADAPGGGALYASSFLLVDTPAQAEGGYEDSVEAALSDWSTLSPGGDPDDPVVQAFLSGTTELAAWFEVQVGAELSGPYSADKQATTPRIHNLSVSGSANPGKALANKVEPITWTSHRAEALVTEGERVVGAEFTDLRTGEVGWVSAQTTIVATGGFARNPDEVSAHRPELAGMALLFEIHPAATGGGLPLLEQVNAATQNEGNVGLYAHAVEDPRAELAGEAIWLTHLSDTLMVDELGQRNFSEEEIFGFQMADHLMNAGGQRLFAVFPGQVWDAATAIIPAYNPGEGSKERDRTLRATEFEALGGGARYASIQEAATAQGLPADTLALTLARYNLMATEGADEDHAKDASKMVPIEGEFVIVELQGGLAKCFTGAALDAQGRVLAESGDPIPGLYAAGEVAGMLGVQAVGSGFEGSISAVYWTGRRAGVSAAVEALDR